MVPVGDATVVEADMPLSQFFEIARETGFTRFPVRNGDGHTFVGVINVFFVLSHKGDRSKATVRDFMRNPLEIPADMPVDDIFPRLRRSRQPMALVRDQNHGVIGIVTTENVLEEIVR